MSASWEKQVVCFAFALRCSGGLVFISKINLLKVFFVKPQKFHMLVVA